MQKLSQQVHKAVEVVVSQALTYTEQAKLTAAFAAFFESEKFFDKSDFFRRCDAGLNAKRATRLKGLGISQRLADTLGVYEDGESRGEDFKPA